MTHRAARHLVARDPAARRQTGGGPTRSRAVSARGAARVFTLYVLLAIVAVIFVFPLYWLASSSFKELEDIYTYPPVLLPKHPTLANYPAAWGAAPFGNFYVNSVVTTLAGTGLELVNAVFVAYAFVFLPFPGKKVLFTILLASLMVPIYVTILPNYLTVASLGWLNTYEGIVIPSAAVAFGAFLLRQHMLTLPKEVIEAATLDGAGHLRRLWHVVLPLSRPMVVTFGLISLVGKWNDFLWPLIVTNTDRMRTLPVGISFLFREEGVLDWGLIMAGTVFVVLPILLIYLAGQRHIVAGLSQGAIK